MGSTQSRSAQSGKDFTQVSQEFHTDCTGISPECHRDFRSIFKGFQKNFTKVSQDYFCDQSFPNSTFSMLLVEEEDEQGHEQK